MQKCNNGIEMFKCEMEWDCGFGEQWHPFDTHTHMHTFIFFYKRTNRKISSTLVMYVFQWWLLCLHSSTIYFQLQEYETKTGQFVVNLKNNKTEYCGYVVYKPSIELGRSESENATFCVTLPGEEDKCNLFSSYTKQKCIIHYDRVFLHSVKIPCRF